jgi:uncharacterized membrane protein
VSAPSAPRPDGRPRAAQPDASAAVPVQTATPPVRFRRLRRYLRGLDHIGLVFALLAFLSSLTPTLLPRSWPVQGLVSGLGAAAAYAVGVVVTWIGRRAGVPALSPRANRRIRYVITAFAVVSVSIMLWLSAGWENEVRRVLDMPPQGGYRRLGVLVIAAAAFAAVIGIARLIRHLYGVVLRRLPRFSKAPATRLVAAALVTAFIVTLFTGTLYRGLIRVADNAFSVVDRRTEARAVQPSSPLRSGGTGSLVPWSSLGREGRDFVSAGPTVTDIERLTGRPAIAPIRAYAGLSSAPDMQSEAELVLSELRRAGAFNRALLAVATTTGTGWIDPALAGPLEYMYGGNTAIAAMQYSYLPSWISFVVDKNRSRDAARTLFDVVYDYWATLPPQHRPRLVAVGESLGTFAGSAAFSSLADLTARTQGALFVGPPNDTVLWQRLTDVRVRGTPERLPVYGDGSTVRFAATAADLPAATASVHAPRVVFVQHASDPVVWWSPSLIWSEPDWLREPRGPDVLPEIRWFPLVTFWQLTGDLAIAQEPPVGHGHNYGVEVAAAWASILHPPGWTAADTVALGSRS